MTAVPSASVPNEEHGSRIFLRLLADFCRKSPKLKTWLLDDFVHDAAIRARFRKLITDDKLSGETASNGFAALADELEGWAEEKRRIRSKLPANTAQLFGGLTWREIEALIRRYEARSINLGVFRLVRDWRKAGKAAKSSPKLLRAGAELLDDIIGSDNTLTLLHMRRSVELLSSMKRSKLRSAIGYTDWWKLHALLYMLRHPREAYRTREVRAHLNTLGLEISSLDFRRFCKRHCIRRDERAGRPRNSSSSLRG